MRKLDSLQTTPAGRDQRRHPTTSRLRCCDEASQTYEYPVEKHVIGPTAAVGDVRADGRSGCTCTARTVDDAQPHRVMMKTSVDNVIVRWYDGSAALRPLERRKHGCRRRAVIPLVDRRQAGPGPVDALGLTCSGRRRVRRTSRCPGGSRCERQADLVQRQPLLDGWARWTTVRRRPARGASDDGGADGGTAGGKLLRHVVRHLRPMDVRPGAECPSEGLQDLQHRRRHAR